MTNEELAYMAGIIDGEGSVGVTKCSVKNVMHGPRYTNAKGKEYGARRTRMIAHIDLKMSDKETVELFYLIFGGTMVKSKPVLGHKDMWVWRVSNNKALEVAETLHPYLRIKKRQAGLLIIFQKDRGQSRRKDSFLKEVDEMLYNNLKKLNATGKELGEGTVR